VYRHCDGYPDGMGCDLERFFAGLGTCPEDPTSVAARFVVWQEKQGHDCGIVLQDPGDIEYRYLVDCDGSGQPEVEIQDLFPSREHGE